MKNQKISLFLLVIVFLATSCGKSIESRDSKMEKSAAPSSASSRMGEESQTMADSSVSVADIISSKAAVVSNIDSIRKFIRTADIEFKVKSVFQTTQDIEQLATNMGGFVTSSNLENEIIDTKTKKISVDSSIIITEYFIKSIISLRVPREKMDSFLRSLSPMVVFIKKRIVTSEDIHIAQLSSELERIRNQNFVDETEKAGQKGVVSRQASLEAQARADGAKIDQLIQSDKVMYSTINISIYEHSKVKYEKFENIDESQFEASFGARFIQSVKTGFFIIEELILFAIKLWGLIAMGLLIYFSATYIYRKTKK